jgi:hypothetical protein
MRHKHTSPRVPQSASVRGSMTTRLDGACASHVSRPEVRETHVSRARESSNPETTALLSLTRHLQCARIQHDYINIFTHLFLRPHGSHRLVSRGEGEEGSTYTHALRSLQWTTSGTNQSCKINCIVLRLHLSFSLVRTSRGGTAAPRMALGHPCYPSLSHTPLTLLTDMPESWMPDGYPDQQPHELTSYVKIPLTLKLNRGETAEPLPQLQMP